MAKQKKNPLFFLYHIKESIEAICVHLSDGKESFFHNRTVQMAVLKELEIIGEAANNIPEELQQKYSSVPWRDIIDFRNILAHHYWAIDLNTVWNIINEQDKLPEVNLKINLIIDELECNLNQN